jgi:cell division protein FtsL
MEKPYAKLNTSCNFYKWLSLAFFILIVVAWSSSANTNRQARLLVEDNKKLQQQVNDYEIALESCYSVKSLMEDGFTIEQAEDMLED